VAGSQIVVVVDALGGIAAVGGVGVMPGGGAVGGVGLVVVDVVGDGWAAWRRTEAVRTTLPGLTVAHSSAQRRVLRPFPRFQAVVTRAHDVARARAPAQLPFPHAKVARRSPAHAVFSQALAMECPRSLPLRRAFAAVTVACSASAGAAMSPATSRAPTTTASQDARRRGHFMLRCSFARPNDSARWRLPPLPSGPVRLRDLLAGTLREQVPKLNLRRFLANSAESCSQSGSI
jgi:hypothetical protein